MRILGNCNFLQLHVWKNSNGVVFKCPQRITKCNTRLSGWEDSSKVKKIYIYIADFSKLVSSLYFLFSEAKSFNFFLFATQRWVGGNIFKTLSIHVSCHFLFDSIVPHCIIDSFA